MQLPKRVFTLIVVTNVTRLTTPHALDHECVVTSFLRVRNDLYYIVL
jgi:hypothetical protein